nr:unnamed protein product [Digitaria exilis]
MKTNGGRHTASASRLLSGRPTSSAACRGVTAEGEGVNAESSACSVASTPEVTDKKSSALLDVKPWDDETDMRKLEDAVRGVKMKGLLWGAYM